MGSWITRRWNRGRASMLLGILLVLFGVSIALMPRNGCGPLVVEMFDDRVAIDQNPSGPTVRYMCGSMARTGVPVAVAVSLFGLWFIAVPGRRRAEVS